MKKSVKIVVSVLMFFFLFAGVIYLYCLQPRGIPVLQGVTDSVSTQFVAVVPKTEYPKCFAKEIEGTQEIPSLKEATRRQEYSAWAIHKCQFTDLDYKKNYELLIKNSSGETLVRRKFGLINPEQKNARIAIYSCSNDWYHFPWIWQTMEAQNPNLIFAIGDNVYADVYFELTPIPISTETLFSRYVATWRVLGLFKFDPLVPIIGLWDDHDFGKNNSSSDFILKNESKEIFEDFFGQADNTSNFQKGPGSSSVLKAFGVQFVFLDGRSFRSDKRSAESSYFSSEQIQWAKNLLLKEPGPTWLISGTQFFSRPPVEESFELEHPEGFTKFNNIMKSTNRDVFLVSGDTHFTELKKIGPNELGHPTYEVTSSAIHSLPLGFPGPDNRRVWSVLGPNFVTATFETNDPRKLSIEVYRWSSDPVKKEEITFGNGMKL